MKPQAPNGPRGMESPHRGRYEVLCVGTDGSIRTFAQH
jgi:hypothetical protein